MSFGEENVDKFTIGNISYFSESGIWLGKILVNGVHFTNVFPYRNFAPYVMLLVDVNQQH